MDKRKQDLFAFARMTPAEYLEDLAQLRLPAVAEHEAKIQAQRQQSYDRVSLDDSE